jgi:glycosyltransferase involved in cell wall biosynthesis
METSLRIAQPMRIIVCHNYYQQPGGEDQVFRDEVTLLESHGHQVATFVIHNDTIRKRSKLKVACETMWNRRVASELAALVRKEEAEIVHFHNTFPLISPAAYHAVREAGAAVVQTLHNFRLLCPGATFIRDGQVCERCLGKAVPWPAVAHRCYRGSLSGSTVVAVMLAAHRLFRTWDQAVDRYIALTEFARQTFLRGGLPAEKVVVKGNFVAPSPPVGRGQGSYALFAGRLVPEKGLGTLLEAWKGLAEAGPLKILGDGPLAAHVQKAIQGNSAVEWLGSRPHAEVQDLLGEAQMLILPSTWYEGFPKILVEALAKGTPVVASRLGAMAELIDDGRTGLLFEPGNAEDLAAKVRQFAGDPCRRAAMRQAARKCFEDNHTAERNYRQLVAIYHQALAPIQAGACRPENLPMCLHSKPSDPCGGYESTR